MRRLPLIIVTIAALFLLWLTQATLFIVYPWQSTLILQFGELITVKQEPGLYAKLPWQDARFFDSRVLTIDTEDPDRYITAEKENLLVDSYIKWRIVDPKKYYETVRGQESLAVRRLLEIINRGLRDEIGKRTVKDVVTGEREKVMEIMRARADEAAVSFGMKIVDVRLKRVDLPLAVSENVYKNMIEERRRIANERRSTGEAEKEKIKAEADRDRTIILAEAMRDAERMRGEGDGVATKIYATAFNQDKSFYDFYRSMEAYRNTLGTQRDFFLLSPRSDFFRYLKNESGNAVYTDEPAGGKAAKN